MEKCEDHVMKHEYRRRYKCNFMLGWSCILNYMNNNQLGALFIFSLLSCHTSTSLGRVSSLSGGRMYICAKLLLFIIFSGTVAQRGLWHPRSRGFVITHNDTPKTVGLLWTSDQLVAETSTLQHTQQTNIHAPGGIRNHDRSSRATVDLHLRSRGHWDRYVWQMVLVILLNWLSAGLAS
jgi:hypothetical protein